MSSLLLFGDDFEKFYYKEFVRDKFPSYEKFWSLYIFPLRLNPQNINHYLYNANEYKNYIAQLHYSILKSLIRCYTICQKLKNETHHYFQMDDFIDGMSRIYSATDLAFEFLQRINSEIEEKIYCKKTSYKLRGKWICKNEEIHQIRYYRNLLIHGCLLPSTLINGKIYFPKIGNEKDLNSWRKSLSILSNNDLTIKYFDSIDNILVYSFDVVLEYFEQKWSQFLVKSQTE